MKPNSIIDAIEKVRFKIGNNSEKTKKFLIAPNMKKPLIKWLNSEGISESYLFPEMPYVMKSVREKFYNIKDET